jgi:hypothetical protein
MGVALSTVQRVKGAETILLPPYLCLDNCIYWADLQTGPTRSAFTLIDHIFFLAFFNSVCGTLLRTGSARNALITYLISHASHLLNLDLHYFLLFCRNDLIDLFDELIRHFLHLILPLMHLIL